MALLKCPECGADVSSNAQVCMNCGYPVSSIIKNEKEKSDKKKRTIKIVIPIFIVAVTIAILALKISDSSTKNSFFHEVEWQTSYDDTKAALEQKGEKVIATEEKDQLIIGYDDYHDIKGLSGMVIYSFENELLKSVTIAIMNSDDCDMSDNEIGSMIKAELVEAYGEPIGEDEWETEDSSIKYLYALAGMHGITYDAK